LALSKNETCGRPGLASMRHLATRRGGAGGDYAIAAQFCEGTPSEGPAGAGILVVSELENPEL
jgi:hypothetical protein